MLIGYILFDKEIKLEKVRIVKTLWCLHKAQRFDFLILAAFVLILHKERYCFK